ncbi:MAG TPA: hypothetical protein VLG27_01165 [Candidatus Saccharimonadia bacterium]|nr:hypothetical protein [Candidatus Saccharimonadia bacterium]
MSEILHGTTPSIEEQKRLYRATNLGLMNWLEEKGTLTVAKKFFAKWLFTPEGGDLELYADEITPQQLAGRLSTNGSYSLLMSRDEERLSTSLTWYEIVFDSGIFAKGVVVGKVRRTPNTTTDEPFYYRGFDQHDLDYVKEAATRLDMLRTSGLPNLSEDLYEIQDPSLHA